MDVPELIAPRYDILSTTYSEKEQVLLGSKTIKKLIPAGPCVHINTPFDSTPHHIMCSICNKILAHPSLCPPHSELYCPLSQADYCSICATSGHTTEECGQAQTLVYRQPQFYEQILHPGELELYGLQGSSTPLPSVAKPIALPKDPRMTIPEYDDQNMTDRAIQGVLRAHNITPGNKKKNKDLIDRLARSKGMRLVFRKV